MSEADARDQQTVCHCMGVTRGRLLRAVREEGARSVEDLQRLTAACCGCGTCRWDLEDLLAEAVPEVERGEG